MKKILIINLGGMGDLLLAQPAVRALKKSNSDTEISLLVVKRVFKMAKKLPDIDNSFFLCGGIRGFLKDLATLFKLRNAHFDLAINMRSIISESGALKIKFLLSIINAAKTAGRNTEGRGKFFDISIPEDEKSKKHEITYNNELVEMFGLKVVDEKINWNISEKSIEKIRYILAKEQVKDDDVLIGVHPGGLLARRWPLDNFLDLINKLSQQGKYKFVISGGPKEIDLGKYLEKHAKQKVINSIGKVNLDESFALIKRCNCFISNDTGPMHFAAVLNTPLVGIVGPGDIGHYDPRRVSKKAIVLKKDLDCSPCSSKINCDDRKCLEAIKVEEVIEAVKRLL